MPSSCLSFKDTDIISVPHVSKIGSHYISMFDVSFSFFRGQTHRYPSVAEDVVYFPGKHSRNGESIENMLHVVQKKYSSGFLTLW